MKNFLIVLLFFCLGVFSVAQELPIYDGEGASVVMLVNIKAYKGVQDNIVLVNLANPNNTSFSIYIYEDDGWHKFGYASLQYLHDREKIEGRTTSDFGAYKYAAIVPLDGKKYSYEARVENHDLHFYILPENPSYSAFESNATEFDVSAFQKKVKDNIRLVAYSSEIFNTGFFIFADNGSGFRLIAAAHLKNVDDTCFAEGFDLNLKEQKYFRYAVAASDGKKYNCFAQAKNNDLYIFIED